MQNFITGGAGFIGSYLTERILSHTEDSVVIYDNFSSGSKKNIEHLLDNRRVTIIEGDITDKNMVMQYADTADRIYHLAAVAGVGNVVYKPD
jgi:dTDP-D-glucose 4,6-dehydratase